MPNIGQVKVLGQTIENHLGELEEHVRTDDMYTDMLIRNVEMLGEFGGGPGIGMYTKVTK